MFNWSNRKAIIVAFVWVVLMQWLASFVVMPLPVSANTWRPHVEKRDAYREAEKLAAKFEQSIIDLQEAIAAENRALLENAREYAAEKIAIEDEIKETSDPAKISELALQLRVCVAAHRGKLEVHHERFIKLIKELIALQEDLGIDLGAEMFLKNCPVKPTATP